MSGNFHAACSEQPGAQPRRQIRNPAIAATIVCAPRNSRRFLKLARPTPTSESPPKEAWVEVIAKSLTMLAGSTRDAQVQICTNLGPTGRIPLFLEMISRRRHAHCKSPRAFCLFSFPSIQQRGVTIVLPRNRWQPPKLMHAVPETSTSSSNGQSAWDKVSLRTGSPVSCPNAMRRGEKRLLECCYPISMGYPSKHEFHRVVSAAQE